MIFVLFTLSVFSLCGGDTYNVAEDVGDSHRSFTTSVPSVCDSEQTMSSKSSLMDALSKSARAKGPLAIGKAFGYLTAEESLQIVTKIFLSKNPLETLECLLDDDARANAQAAAVDFLDRNIEGEKRGAHELWQDCVRIVNQSFEEMGKKIAALKTASRSQTSEESLLDLCVGSLDYVAKIARFLSMAEQVRTAKNDFMAQVCLSDLKKHSEKSDKEEEEGYLASLRKYSLT